MLTDFDFEDIEYNERQIDLELVEAIGLNFAAELPENATPEQMARTAPALIKYILQEGDKGYKGEVSALDPVPSSDNAYLWDEDEEAFVGQFVDRRFPTERRFSFTISRDGENWSKNIQVVSGVE